VKRRSAGLLPKVRKPSTAVRASASNTKERYRLVVEAVAEGIYEWSTLELSSRLNEMGFEKGELTLGNWLQHVYPDRSRYGHNPDDSAGAQVNNRSAMHNRAAFNNRAQY